MDDKPIRGLEISAVVKMIIGPPNSRVALGIQRPRESAHISPTPVVISPFQQKEIVLRRELTARDSKVAGIGIHFQKVGQKIACNSSKLAKSWAINLTLS